MIKKIKNSLTVKIFLVTGVLLILCCTLTYGFIAWLVPQTYSSDLNAELEQKVQSLITDVEKMPFSDSGNLFDEFILNNDVLLQFFNATGQELALPSNASSLESQSSEGIGVATEGVSSETYGAIHKYVFTFSDTMEQYTLSVAGSTQAVNQVANAITNIFPLLILLILSVSAIASVAYSRYVTRPVLKISAVSKQMSALDLNWECDESRTDELGLLARNLNNLSHKLSAALSELQTANAKLQNDIDLEKQLEKVRLDFFSAVSHELKTPITVIKGQLEGMLLCVGRYKDRDKYLSRSLEVATTLENMVQEILTVSRIESSGFALNYSTFDFGEMVKTQSVIFEDMIIQKDLKWQANIQSNLPITADKLLLQKVVSNLISNAVHYSPTGNSIHVSVENRNNKVAFAVENTGVHINETDLSKLFDAFYRVEQSRNRQTGGSGLGLYIVKMILEQHEADYHISNTASGVQFDILFK